MLRTRDAIEAFGLAACLIAGCSSSETDIPISTAVVTQSIAAKDSLGTNASEFFPIGMFIEGAARGDLLAGSAAGCGSANGSPYYFGAAPPESGDASRYFDETSHQLAANGFNSIIFVNADDQHGQSLLNAANSAGLYVVYAPKAFVPLKDSRCAIPSDSTVQSEVQSATTTFSGYPALQDYYTVDEPNEARLVSQRYASKWLSTSDPAHTGMAMISVIPTSGRCAGSGTTCTTNDQCTAPGDWCNSYARTRIIGMDKALAYDHVATDGTYPLTSTIYVGETVPLELWDGQVDLAYAQTPIDKPLYQIIQADTWDSSTRMPTPAEVRYLTYAALARGVKGIYWFFYQRETAMEGGIADYSFNVNNTGLEVQRLASEVRTLAPWLIDATRDYVSKTVTPIASVTGTTNYDDDATSFTTKFGEKLVMVVNEHLAHAYCSTTTLRVCDTSSDCPFGETCTCPPNETCDSNGSPSPRSFQVVAQMPNALVAKLPGGCSSSSFTVRDLLSNATLTSSLSCLPGCIGCSLSFTTPSLQPGDGKLYQLESPLSADIRVARDSYNNPISSSKGVSVTLTAKNVGTTTWTTTGHHLGIHVYAPNGTNTDITGLSLGTSNVMPGQTVQLTVNIAAGTLSVNGTYGLGFDLYQDGTPNIWFANEQRIAVMVAQVPLLVDTFDSVPYNHPTSSLSKWESSPLMSIRNDMLAINGENVHLSNKGDSWQDYTFEFDAMIDSESRKDASSIGWVARAHDGSNVGYLFRLAADDATDPTVAPGGIQVFSSTDAAPANSLVTFVANKQCTGGTNPNAVCTSSADCTGGGSCTTSMKRGTVYHIKEVISGLPNPGVTINTYVNGVLRNTLVDTSCTGCTAGHVGFRLYESTDICQVGNSGSTCQGGGAPDGLEDKCCSNTSLPCVYDTDCSGGGTCQEEVPDQCLPGLERGHFDNVFVYTSGTPPTPAQVTGVTVTGTSSNQLQLIWQPVQDSNTSGASVSHYRVYRGSTPSSLSLIAEPAGSNYLDLNVTPGTTYYYAVSAVNNINLEGSQSTQASGSVAAPTASAVSFTVNDMKSVTVTWTGSANKYEVHRGAPGFTPSASNLLATVTSTSYSDSPTSAFVTDAQVGLRGFTSYQYAIVPLSTDGSGHVVATGASALSSTATTPGSNLFSDALTNSSKWTTCTAGWSADGVFHQTSTSGVSAAAIANRTFGDMSIELTVQIVNDPSDPGGQNWAGITIHKSTASSSCTKLGDSGYSGYLIYYRSNGRIEIFSPANGTVVAWADTGLDPKTAARKLRVDTTGRWIKVSVDGTKFLEWHPSGGPNQIFGYVDLTTYNVAANYDNVNIFFRDDFNGYNDAGTSGTQTTRDNWSAVVEGFNTTAPFDLAGIGQLQFDANAGGVAYALAPIGVSVADFEADYAIKIDSAYTSNDWAAFAFRKTNIGDNEFTSGYMVYWRENNSLELYKAGGTLYESANPTITCSPVTPTINVVSDYQLVHLSVHGSRIKVSVNGSAPVLDCTDPLNTYNSGYVHLEASQTEARFEFLEIY